AISAAQKLQIAGEVLRSRAKLEGDVGLARNRENDAERALDFGVAQLGQALLGGRESAVAAPLFFAETAAESLPHVKQRNAQIEAGKRSLAHLVGNAETAVGT